MKKIVTEELGEGLEKLLGQRVTLYCVNYIYTGILSGVNDTCVLLTQPKIVYETGAHTDSDWKLAEPFPSDWYVMRSAIESFGVWK